MPKKITALLLAAVMLFSFSGCEFFDRLYDMHLKGEQKESSSLPEEESLPELTEADPNWPVTVCNTEIAAMPQKVAAASPALVEYISDLGLLSRLCAACDFCAFSKEAEALPSVGSPSLPDFDSIKSAEPEYILTLAEYDEASLIKLQQMNITVLVFSSPKNFDELRALYKELALFFLGAEEGAAAGEAFVQKYNAALDETAYSGEKSTALFLRGMDNIVITGDSLGGEILSRCFVNAAGEASGFEYPADGFSDLKPDIIFVGGTVRLKDLESSDLYRKKSAVKNDRVFLADLDALNIASLRALSVAKDMMATAYEDYSGGTKLEVAYPSIYQ